MCTCTCFVCVYVNVSQHHSRRHWRERYPGGAVWRGFTGLLFQQLLGVNSNESKITDIRVSWERAMQRSHGVLAQFLFVLRCRLVAIAFCSEQLPFEMWPQFLTFVTKSKNKRCDHIKLTNEVLKLSTGADAKLESDLLWMIISSMRIKFLIFVTTPKKKQKLKMN